MHHKRRRPKHLRNGCLLCKPWKNERGARSLGVMQPRYRRDAPAALAEIREAAR